MDIGIYHLRAGVAIGGGKAVYVRNMMAALADEHDITLYTGAGSVLESVSELPVDVVQIPYGRTADRLQRASLGTLSSSICASLAMAFTARRQRAFDRMARHDCLWTHFWIDDILASRSAPIPVVNHAHGYEWEGIGAGASLRKHLSSSKFCLANSKTTARTLREELGIDSDGIVPPGVDIEQYSPAVTPAIQPETPMILFVGRLVERKGIFDLIDAYTNIREEVEAELYIVGSGGEQQALQRIIDSRGLEESIHLLGNIPIEELPGYYAAADLVCHPSHWESFAIVNIEAIACGAPVITTRLDAVEDYITDGETGILVPPNDPEALAGALKQLLDDDALREQLAIAGREVATSYSWERQASTLTNTLQRLLFKPTSSSKKGRNRREDSI
jgi:glycosyltransferase involved in cell wall biosynthesis